MKFAGDTDILRAVGLTLMAADTVIRLTLRGHDAV
jgi:hypothetical protein